MFLDFIQKLIPNSLKAGAALVAVLLFLPLGLSGFSQLLIGQSTPFETVKTLVLLVVGFAAGVVFYYFQAKDGSPSSDDGMEILHRHYKDQQDSQRLRDAQASVPKFPGEEDTTDKSRQ